MKKSKEFKKVPADGVTCFDKEKNECAFFHLSDCSAIDRPCCMVDDESFIFLEVKDGSITYK